MFFKNPQLPTEDKLVKLMENPNALLVCSEKFSRDSGNKFLERGTQQNNFVKKIHDATLVKLNNNPFQSLWSAIQSEILKGSLNICSARITGEHRVFFIAKHSIKLDKIVIYLIEDDPRHKYNLDKIKASYQSKKRSCGSKEDWEAIFDMVYNHKYLQVVKPQFLLEEKKAEVPQEKPLNETPAESPTQPPLDDHPKVEEKLELQSAELTAVSEEPQALPEDKSEAAVKKKKKKKKKTNSVSEETLVQILESFLQNSGSSQFAEDLHGLFTETNKTKCLKIVSGLLDLGMNPEMTGLMGENLLRCAIMYQHVEVVKLLLDWDVDLITIGGLDGNRKEQLLIAINNKDEIEIIKALVKKTKEKGLLNEICIGAPLTLLHFAALSGNIEAVQVLLAEGANPEVRNTEGYTPLEKIQGLFHRDTAAVGLAQARMMKPKKVGTGNLADVEAACQLSRKHFSPMNILEKREYNEIRKILLAAKKPEPESNTFQAGM